MRKELLIEQINSLLALDRDGALRPHGLGGLARDLFERSVTALTNPVDDWTVDDTETAGEILTMLGIGCDASKEPGADWRRDKIAKIIRARIVSSSPGKDGGPEVEAVGELREALQRLEDCCDQLAGTRSREVYDAMINSGQAEALIDLDNARLNAREVLSRPSPYPVSDTVAVVTGDAALALGLPEGTKLYTRHQPASTALVEIVKELSDHLAIHHFASDRHKAADMVARARAALSASQSTSREGER